MSSLLSPIVELITDHSNDLEQLLCPNFIISNLVNLPKEREGSSIYMWAKSNGITKSDGISNIVSWSDICLLGGAAMVRHGGPFVPDHVRSAARPHRLAIQDGRSSVMFS